MAAAFSAAGRRLLKLPQAQPFLFGAGFSCCKTAFADYLVQTQIERREKYDYKRTAAFASFGLVYLGGFQYFLYINAFKRIFPRAEAFAAKSWRQKMKDKQGQGQLIGQVFFDQCIHHPFVYFPVFYMTKDLVTSKEPSVTAALGEYRKNMGEDVLSLWKFWVPAMTINFAFLPMWGRIPWVATVSLAWTMVLSAMRGSSEVPMDPDDVDSMAMGGHVSGTTMKMMTQLSKGRREMSRSRELDPTQEHMVIVAHAPDRRGLAASVIREVSETGANIGTAKMLKLGGDFTMMIHVETAHQNLQLLKDRLAEKHGDLSITTWTVNPQSADTDATAQQLPLSLKVRLEGGDKPGLAMRLTAVFEKHRLNIENFQSEQRLRMVDSPIVGVVEIDLTGDSSEVDYAQLVEDIEALSRRQGVDIKIEDTSMLDTGMLEVETAAAPK